MTLAIQQRQATSTQVDTLDQKIQWCEMMAHGDMLPAQYRRKPANLLFAVEYADALGIPRINAITSVHVIEGKPSASADLIGSLVRKAGHRLRVRVEGGGIKAVVTATIVRADDPDFEFKSVWNWTRALNAGVTGKDNWKKWPEAMMKARAITEVAREAASDALFGVVYTPEELDDVVDEDGNVVDDADAARREATRAQATRVHPEQEKQQPQQAPKRTEIEIAADIVIAADAGENETVKTLWREARANGYGDLIEDTNALMGDALPLEQFVDNWIPAPEAAAPQDAPEPAPEQPETAPDAAPRPNTVQDADDAQDDDVEVLDAEPMFDIGETK